MPKLKYETDEGTIGITRVGKGFDTVDIYGAPPAGIAQVGVYFRKAGSRRQAGTQVRYLAVSKNDGPKTPSGQQPKLYGKVTIGTPEHFATFSDGDVIDLPDGTYTVDALKKEG